MEVFLFSSVFLSMCLPAGGRYEVGRVSSSSSSAKPSSMDEFSSLPAHIRQQLSIEVTRKLYEILKDSFILVRQLSECELKQSCSMSTKKAEEVCERYFQTKYYTSLRQVEGAKRARRKFVRLAKAQWTSLNRYHEDAKRKQNQKRMKSHGHC